MIGLGVRTESWPIRGGFAISRGRKTEAQVVVVELTQGDAVGRGECVPYQRYGESLESVVAAIEGLRDALAGGLDRVGLQRTLPAGAARNALDCAFWDLEAQQRGSRVWQLLGLDPPRPVTSAYTLSLDRPEAMARAAAENAWRPLLKLKLAGPEDLARVEAVRAAAPESRMVVDANEGWTPGLYAELAPHLATLGVELIEQPLAADQDAALASMQRPVKVAADESCHDLATLAGLKGRYDMVNIKLDKTGGLTEALTLKAMAEAAGFGIMVGCMMATSLSMAPAFLVAQGAQVVDLDAPLILARDHAPGLVYEGSLVHAPSAQLWG